MTELKEIDENNWLQAAQLKVAEEQKFFVAQSIGILARGYVYREDRARVFAISDGNELVGLAMVRDLDEEPACYDLQQFMIDEKFQGKGYGTEALEKILKILGEEGKYSCVEVCVKKEAKAAFHVYEKAGFHDTGYVDEDAPDSCNLMYRF